MTELIVCTIDTRDQTCQEIRNVAVLHIFFSCVSRNFSLRCMLMTMSYFVFFMSHI
jgi:hypothetical protein